MSPFEHIVSMQFPVQDQVALDFAGLFYSSLGEGLPVDAAVTQARRSLFLRLGQSPPQVQSDKLLNRDAALSSPEADWGSPVVYMRSPDGLLFDLPKKRQTPLNVRGRGRRPLKFLSGSVALLLFLALLSIYSIYFADPALVPPPPLVGKVEIVARMGSGADMIQIAELSGRSAESIDQQVAGSQQLQSRRLLIYGRIREASSAKPLAIFEQGQRIHFDSEGFYSTEKPTIQDFRDDSRSGAYCRSGEFREATGSGACSHHGGVRTWTHKPEVVVALLCNDNRSVAGADEKACGSAGVALQIKNEHFTDFVPAPHDEE